jgi:hypothetical protein
MTKTNRFGIMIMVAALVLTLSPNLAYAKSTSKAEGTNNFFATADALEIKTGLCHQNAMTVKQKFYLRQGLIDLEC